MEQNLTKARKAQEKKERPKVTFVHRLTWLCGGEGKLKGSLWTITDGLVLGENIDDNGLLLAGSKWCVERF
eukprot:SAG11_NODE_4620_length_1832_cov_1.500866_2_plen_71_part_00